MRFYLSLMFMVLSKVALSTPVNKTYADGKVVITGDHNEVVVSTAHETKIAALSAQVQAMSQRLTALEKHGSKQWCFPERSTLS